MRHAHEKKQACTYPVLLFRSVRAVQRVSDCLLLVPALLATARSFPARQHFLHYRSSAGAVSNDHNVVSVHRRSEAKLPDWSGVLPLQLPLLATLLAFALPFIICTSARVVAAVCRWTGCAGGDAGTRRGACHRPAILSRRRRSKLLSQGAEQGYDACCNECAVIGFGENASFTLSSLVGALVCTSTSSERSASCVASLFVSLKPHLRADQIMQVMLSKTVFHLHVGCGV